MNLLLLLQRELSSGRTSATLPASDPRALYIKNHLKKAEGDTIKTAILDIGFPFQSTISFKTDNSSVTLTFPSPSPSPTSMSPPSLIITIILAMCSPHSLKRLLPQVSEATSTTTSYYSTHFFDSLHSFCSCFIKNAPRFARRRLRPWECFE